MISLTIIIKDLFLKRDLLCLQVCLKKKKEERLTTVVYAVQIIPVENRDTHMLSPVAEMKVKRN